MSTTTTTASPLHLHHHSSNHERHQQNSHFRSRHYNLTLEDALGEFSDALEAAAQLGEDAIIDLLMGWARDLRLGCACDGEDGKGRGSTDNETRHIEHTNGQGDVVDFQQQNWDDGNHDEHLMGRIQNHSESEADKHDDFVLDMLDEVVQTMSQQTETMTDPMRNCERLLLQSQDEDQVQLELEKGHEFEAQFQSVTLPSTFSQEASQPPSHHHTNYNDPEVPTQPQPQAQSQNQKSTQQTDSSAPPQPPNPILPALLIPPSCTSETYLRGLTTNQLISYGIPTRPLPAALESKPWNRWKWRSAKIALYGRQVTGIHQCYLCQKKPKGARYEGCITWIEGATGGGGARMGCANCTWRKKRCLWPDEEGRFVLPEKGEKGTGGEGGPDGGGGEVE